MVDGEIFGRYINELGYCKYYELKCLRHLKNNNEEKYEKYWVKYQMHKKMAEKYYTLMKEMAVFSDFLEDESIFTDSSFFDNKS